MTSYLCSEFYGHDWLQTCRYKTKELWGLFAEVREKSVLGFQSYWHFLWKCSFKDMPISQTFFYYKKINNSFLKFDHSLLRMPKIIEIGQIFLAEKRDWKNNQRAYK